MLERWRDDAAGERLARLAAAEMITPDAKAAAGELLTAVQKLLEQGAGARLDELIEKSRGAELSDTEKTELKTLMLVRSRQG